MYIQEIIIDGFKSYATRTIISGFDPQFNAITGLNGSGKSNILDSICFVLGISNLSQVRVGNLQELVYKQGQAGVTKASVTIVFDNSDPSCSPVGYEHQKQITVTRQVVIGGKNKYMINGHTVQQTQVQNFFHSVQLNVNNPHFLIMQGRITKVLNMKPIEILSMIEEAAGTRMFETKKQAAIKTIEKKQLKVDEITRILNEDISPRLQNLREEKQSYQEWSNNGLEIEKLEKLCIAFEYQEAIEKVQNSEDHQQQMTNEINQYVIQQNTLQEEINEIENEINVLEKKREEEQEGEYQVLKKKEQDLSKELVKVNTNYQNMKNSIQKEIDVQSSTHQQIIQVKVSIQEKEEELKETEKKYLKKESEVSTLQHEIEVNQTKYQNACAGVVDDQQSDTVAMLSLPEQISLWETKLRESQSRLQQENMKNKHNVNKLKELKKTQEIEQRQYEKDLVQGNQLKKVIQEYQMKLNKLQYNETKEVELKQNYQSLQSELQLLHDKIDNITTQIETRLNFEFRDPERGFDRNRVKGIVAKLVHVKDKIHATALEIAAGGKLYQIVVDNEQTGKLLLGKNVLKKRVTILPLNKISNRIIDSNKLNLAHQIAQSKGGFAELALELIGYDDEVTRAMQHVFGQAIICNSSAVAEAIAFDNNIRCRTITLEGDTYDPSGTISGGSRNQIGALLTKMSELSDLKTRYDECNNQIHIIENELQQIESIGIKHREYQEKLEIKLHELHLYEERLSGSTYSQLTSQIQNLEEDINKFDENVSQPLIDAEQQARDELRRLQETSSGIQSQRNNAIKTMENTLKNLQKRLNTIKNESSSIKSNCDRIRAELESFYEELKTLEDQDKNMERTINKLKNDAKNFENQVNDMKENYEVIKQEMSVLNGNIQKYSKDLKLFHQEKEKKAKEIQSLSLESRKLTHKLDLWKKEINQAQRRVNDLVKKHPWISTEKEYFGMERSDYDFTGLNLKDCIDKLNDLKGKQEKLSKKINKKVMGMIDKAEAESEDLLRKKQVILNDKEKIEAVIEELDVKKIQAIQNTWVRVNKDFGSIFSTLLPGTLAKLDIPEGCTVMDGLEVKVSFNGVWKESLTELSGGQRSLLALSLILALLLFKPAPMYILDEVDAALDLSHTQNIGLMLRTHFSSSQFIVVSLKEGMFNNANVIFRTKFIDGVSTVLRTVAGGRNNANGSNRVLIESTNHNHNHNHNQQGDDETNESPVKKKGKNNRQVPKRSTEIENI